MRSERLLVWDRETDPPSAEALRWRSFGGDCVPAYVEANAERLRAKYLAFVHDVSQIKIAGKKVLDHLAIEDGFSVWWMTRLAEKSPYKSPGIYNALRLLALEEILRERKPAGVELDSGDDDLAEAVVGLCASLDIPCVIAMGEGRARPLRDFVPLPIRGALAFARYVIARRPLRHRGKSVWSSSGEAVFFCSFSLGRNSISHYWGGLAQRLQSAGRPTNWIHHFLPGQTSPSDDFGVGHHAFLDTYLSVGVIVRALRRWLRLNFVSWRLRTLPIGWMWPVHRDDWRTSLAGPVGAVHCLWLELFDSALADLPRQSIGLYLCENQAWEPALLRAWRKHGHGQIVGVAHATVPFWHLYYIDDPRDAATRPAPDRLAVNGPAAARMLAGAGYPMERIVEVEALRYLNIPAPRPRSEAAKKVLILGDVLPQSMHALLSTLEGAIALVPKEYQFTLKPHPLYTVDLSAFPGLRLQTTTDGIEKILEDFDLALAANGTSAAVDAYLAGLTVIVGLNGAELNLSPLRGDPDVRFVGTAAEMANALLSAPRPKIDNFFHLDAEMPRWRRLLKLGVND